MITDVPPTLAMRLVVAYVAVCECGDVVGVELSVRSVQRLLRRRSHRTGASILHRLGDDGWLTIVQPHAGRKAHTYRLGPRAIAEQAEWNFAGDCLFGKDGVMSPWLTSSWLYEKQRGGLGIPGCFVLALLGSDEATTQQVAQRSHGFISQATASRELRVLTARNITTRVASKGSATFRRVAKDEWFRSQAKELRLTDLAAKDDQKIAEERARHDDVVGAARSSHREWLKEQNCVYCLRPSSDEEPIEVEHVPPKKLGGGALTGFEIPAHESCHGRHSAAIRRFSSQRPPSPVYLREVSDDFWDASDEELLDMIAAWVGGRIMHYAAAMNVGDVAKGERTARSIAGIAAATASPQGALILRNELTGAERQLEIDRWFFQREVIANSRAWTGVASGFAELAAPRETTRPSRGDPH